MPTVGHAVIAAAGLGSRLGHGKPKCLVRINGVSVLAHLMHLLGDVEDVRVVVGFMESEVIEELSRIRPDAIVVRNPDFRTTTTLHSYAAGARGLNGDCLFMDADLLIVPDSFRRFLAGCRPGEPRLALTGARSTEAVYVELAQGRAAAFHRDRPTRFEWANISWLPTRLFDRIGPTAVYEHLRGFLPLEVGEVDAYEIDTAEDLEQAKRMAAHFELEACQGFRIPPRRPERRLKRAA